MYWASEVSSIGMQMALPPLVGWWADHSWGTTPWLIIVGALSGFVLGMFSILQMAKRLDRISGRVPLSAADAAAAESASSQADRPSPAEPTSASGPQAANHDRASSAS